MNQNQRYAVIGLVGIAVGFFAGREQMKYQIASAFVGAMGDFAKNMTAPMVPAQPLSLDSQAIAGKVSAEKTKHDAKSYAKQFLKVYDFESKYFTGYDGKVAGVNFKVKNSGDKTVTKLCITVYFQDSSNSNIADEQFCPVLSGGFQSSQPLKPGYVWQQEKGHFYQAPKVPSEWKEGAATAQISEVELAVPPN